MNAFPHCMPVSSSYSLVSNASNFNLIKLISGSPSEVATTSQAGGSSHENEVQSQGLGSTEQLGGSSSSFNADHFVDRIAAIVTEKVTKNLQFRAAQPFTKNYETSEPTITSQVVTNNGDLPPHFGSTIKHNDLADKFDENHLLRLIPKRYKSQAHTLLKVCDERAAEFTFNVNGVIFIDGTSLPGTNIFELFPALFKRTRSRSKLVGFHEVIQKLADMGLSHLIIRSDEQPKVKKEKQKLVTDIPTSSMTNWWYLN